MMADAIANAIATLKQHRDCGEAPHELVVAVAREHGISSDALLAKAERSWGSPLEDDEHHHPEHYEAARRSAEATAWGKMKAANYRALTRSEKEPLFEADLRASDFRFEKTRAIARSSFVSEVKNLELGDLIASL